MAIAVNEPVIDGAIGRDANGWIAFAGCAVRNSSNRPVNAVVSRDRQPVTAAATSIGQIYRAVDRRYLEVAMESAAFSGPRLDCRAIGHAAIETKSAIRRPQSLSAVIDSIWVCRKVRIARERCSKGTTADRLVINA